MQEYYSESKIFWRQPKQPASNKQLTSSPGTEEGLLNYVLKEAEKGNAQSVLAAIDHFSIQHWMMHLGAQKAQIVKMTLKQQPVKKILEVGGYCGYSALLMAHFSGAEVHTIEIKAQYAAIATKIHQHAGMADRIKIHIGTVENSKEYIMGEGTFDAVFIDHVKELYLPDLKLLENFGAIRKGTVVIGDNIIHPGSPDYHQHFRIAKDYHSVLYHSYVQYTDIADAVLVSVKL